MEGGGRAGFSSPGPGQGRAAAGPGRGAEPGGALRCPFTGRACVSAGGEMAFKLPQLARGAGLGCGAARGLRGCGGEPERCLGGAARRQEPPRGWGGVGYVQGDLHAHAPPASARSAVRPPAPAPAAARANFSSPAPPGKAGAAARLWPGRGAALRAPQPRAARPVPPYGAVPPPRLPCLTEGFFFFFPFFRHLLA